MVIVSLLTACAATLWSSSAWAQSGHRCDAADLAPAERDPTAPLVLALQEAGAAPESLRWGTTRPGEGCGTWLVPREADDDPSAAAIPAPSAPRTSCAKLQGLAPALAAAEIWLFPTTPTVAVEFGDEMHFWQWHESRHCAVRWGLDGALPPNEALLTLDIALPVESASTQSTAIDIFPAHEEKETIELGPAGLQIRTRRKQVLQTVTLEALGALAEGAFDHIPPALQAGTLHLDVFWVSKRRGTWLTLRMTHDNDQAEDGCGAREELVWTVGPAELELLSHHTRYGCEQVSETLDDHGQHTRDDVWTQKAHDAWFGTWVWQREQHVRRHTTVRSGPPALVAGQLCGSRGHEVLVEERTVLWQAHAVDAQPAGAPLVSITSKAMREGEAEADTPCVPASSTIRPADDAPIAQIPGGAFNLGLGVLERSHHEEVCATLGLTGCTRARLGTEQPAGDFVVQPFGLDLYEVTRARYERCVQFGFCTAIRTEDCETPAWAVSIDDASPQAPVRCVSRADAMSYCDWVGARLPTELEWEIAAAGVDQRVFPWGEHVPLVGQAGPSVSYASGAVGALLATSATVEVTTPEHVANLAGNVAEWTADDACAPADHPEQGPCERSGELGVVRGGSFADDLAALRTTSRRLVPTAARDATIGFRCATPLPAQATGQP